MRFTPVQTRRAWISVSKLSGPVSVGPRRVPIGSHSVAASTTSPKSGCPARQCGAAPARRSGPHRSGVRAVRGDGMYCFACRGRLADRHVHVVHWERVPRTVATGQGARGLGYHGVDLDGAFARLACAMTVKDLCVTTTMAVEVVRHDQCVDV